jgi:hypothetical protein
MKRKRKIMATTNYCHRVVEDYLKELGSGFSIYPDPDGSRCFIVTPFTRPDGEVIEIALIHRSSGASRLSDMGDTLGYLFVNGLTSTQSLTQTVKSLSGRLNVSLQRQELLVELSDEQKLGESLHALIQAVLQVSDLIQKRRPATRLRFEDELERLLISQGIVYDSNYEVQGRRDKYTIRFHVDSGRKLLIQPLSVASEAGAFQGAERWSWRFSEINRQDASWKILSPLDDRGDRSQYWSPRALNALQNNAEVILWSENQRMVDLLHQDVTV